VVSEFPDPIQEREHRVPGDPQSAPYIQGHPPGVGIQPVSGDPLTQATCHLWVDEMRGVNLFAAKCASCRTRSKIDNRCRMCRDLQGSSSRLDAVERLLPVAEASGISMPHPAMAFAISHPGAVRSSANERGGSGLCIEGGAEERHDHMSRPVSTATVDAAASRGGSSPLSPR
jgi:hypothetical protein